MLAVQRSHPISLDVPSQMLAATQLEEATPATELDEQTPADTRETARTPARSRPQRELEVSLLTTVTSKVRNACEEETTGGARGYRLLATQSCEGTYKPSRRVLLLLRQKRLLRRTLTRWRRRNRLLPPTGSNEPLQYVEAQRTLEGPFGPPAIEDDPGLHACPPHQGFLPPHRLRVA